MTVHKTLPKIGQCGLDQLAATICNGPIASDNELRIKALVVHRPSDNSFVHVATIASLGASTPRDVDAAVDFPIGPFRVLSAAVATGHVSDATALIASLQFWHQHVPYAQDVTGYHFANMQWLPSHNLWAAHPIWIARLNHAGSAPEWDRSLAAGPFFNQEREWFAADLDSIAVAQLESPPGLISDHLSTPAVYIVVPEHRAWLHRLDVDGDRFTVGVRGSDTTGLTCTVKGVDYDGVTHKLVARVSDSVAVARLPRAFREVKVHLWNAAGDILDHYEESEHRSSWNHTVLRPSGADTRNSTLTESLDQGENEHTEFKHWIPPQRTDKKATELLETVVAFSNSHGGDVFIGVDDDANVRGIGSELLRAFKLPIDAAKDRYSFWVKTFVAEGVSPSVALELRWLDFVSHEVLWIKVPVGRDRLYHLTENNRFVQRRGASNRAMSRADIELALRRQVSPLRGI